MSTCNWLDFGNNRILIDYAQKISVDIGRARTAQNIAFTVTNSVYKPPCSVTNTKCTPNIILKKCF